MRRDRSHMGNNLALIMRGRLATLRVGFVVTMIAAITGGFGALLWYVYDLGSEHADGGVIPVIKAAHGPDKIRPENPGGMEVPNQDKRVYDLIDKTAANRDRKPEKVEHLLPPPESPLPRPEPPVQTARPAANSPSGTNVVASPNVPDVQPAAGATTSGVSPKIEAAPKPAAPVMAPPVIEPKVTPPPAAKLEQVADSRNGKAYRIQIASVREAQAADKGWKTLSHRHADLLSRLTPSVVRADLGAKGVFYRLQAGPIASREAADGLCKKLKSRKVGCMVVRP